MSKLLTEQQNYLYILTLNRADKRNAFDDELLELLHQGLLEAEEDPNIRAIVLKANGRHFSAGADLNWMKRMVDLDEADNRADALRFANILHALYQSTKPTIALAQGATYGGGIGLLAACDIVIAANNAQFCFSEVTLGLIPAVISPYVIQAIGQRNATSLFLSAEVFDASRAHALHLVQHCVPEKNLETYGLEFAQRIANFPPQALMQAKALGRTIGQQVISQDVLTQTAEWIAKLRVSSEAQKALHLFLKQHTEAYDSETVNRQSR